MKMLEGISMDLTEDNLNKLKEIFPEVFEEGKIDFDKLRLILGDNIEDKEEKYEFTWNGKNDAIRIAQTPSTGTLRPDKESSKNWDNTENLYIEGDNLEVLKLLQKSYFGKVKMIYIDPPYNTGKDFVYKDNFRDNIANYKEITNQSTKVNPETNGRYHTDWINMMYPRLKLARNLLKEDGVIFISIDDKEVNNLKKICDEIFGENNFRNYLIARRRVKSLNIQFADKGLNSYNIGFEYILVYSKSDSFLFRDIRMEKENIPQKGSWNVFWSNADRPSMRYELLGFTPKTGQWRWSKERANEAVENYKIYENIYSKKLTLEEYWISQNKDLKFIRRIPNGEGKNGGVQYWIPPNTTTLRTSDWTDLEVSQIKKDFDIPFDNPKSTKLIKTIISSCNEEEFIVLDFFAGSSTTAHSVMELNTELGGNRKFIMVQLPEQTEEKSEAYKKGYKNICEIGKERIRRAGDKIVSENKDKEGIEKFDIGFKVFKLDSSNLKSWDSSMENLEQNIIEMDTNLKKDRSKEDLLYEILLKSGVELTAKIEEIKVGYNTLYNIGEGALLACLDDKITQDVIDEIPKHKSKFMETKVIFKEAGFMSDAAKINAIQNLKQFKIEDVRSV